MVVNCKQVADVLREEDGIDITERSVQRFYTRQHRRPPHAEKILDATERVTQRNCEAVRKMIGSLRLEIARLPRQRRGGVRQRQG